MTDKISGPLSPEERGTYEHHILRKRERSDLVQRTLDLDDALRAALEREIAAKAVYEAICKKLSAAQERERIAVRALEKILATTCPHSMQMTGCPACIAHYSLAELRANTPDTTTLEKPNG